MSDEAAIEKAMSGELHSNLNRETKQMYRLLSDLFPLCRSITGDGVRQTLKKINEYIPLNFCEVPTGTEAFDWTVPKEWNIRDAYIADEKGNRIIDFKNSNLHVVGYSVPVDMSVTLSELQGHLHSLEEQPEAIPYITSYYEEYWGFCIAHSQRIKLKEGRYRVFIDSELKDGHLTYAEYIIPGQTEKEILLSTYVCHPSMANNELSGPVVTTFIAKWIASMHSQKPDSSLHMSFKYTYRILFIPETIGSIVYLSKHLDELKNNVIAGFNISCVGDEREYSYISSRYGKTLADKIASNILSFKHPDFIKYSFFHRGSDERQYCAPGVDLPVITLTRSKFGTYPEYHTSLDNLDLVTEKGLRGSYELMKDCIELLERNAVYRIKCYGEPQLGKRGLISNLGSKTTSDSRRKMMDFIAYADGSNDLVDISNIIKVPVCELYPIVEELVRADLLTRE